MSRIAISGHRGLPAETTQLIDREIRRRLADHTPAVVGLSCLADGADQIFARAIVDTGGAIEVIIPAERYREGLPEASHPEYDELLSRARHVHRLAFSQPTSESHMSASRYMLDHADELWAVWDGKPARGYGGTADVVQHARLHDLPVHIIWPNGAQRT
jgi:hypothetical protein